jgi:hypothetical protein
VYFWKTAFECRTGNPRVPIGGEPSNKLTVVAQGCSHMVGSPQQHIKSLLNYPSLAENTANINEMSRRWRVISLILTQKSYRNLSHTIVFL